MFRLIKTIKPYSACLLILWAASIIIISSVQNLPSPRIHTPRSDIRLDYFIHFCEYGVLAFLAYLTFSTKNFEVTPRRFFILTSVLILFAVVDEFHQKLVPGRTFNPRDLAGNIAGIAAALLVCIILFRKMKQEEG